MSYESVTPAFYQYKQPGTPWHPGAPGWSQAPFPGWGMNPNLIGSPRLAVNGCTSCRGTGLGSAWLPVAVYGGFFLAIVGAVAVVGYVTEHRARKRGYWNNPRRRHRRNRGSGCRGRGAYLLKAEKKYPAPTKECLRTALTYASWPDNISQAGRVVRAARRTEWASDPAIRAQINKLAAKYERATGKAA